MSRTPAAPPAPHLRSLPQTTHRQSHTQATPTRTPVHSLCSTPSPIAYLDETFVSLTVHLSQMIHHPPRFPTPLPTSPQSLSSAAVFVRPFTAVFSNLVPLSQSFASEMFSVCLVTTAAFSERCLVKTRPALLQHGHGCGVPSSSWG